MICLYCGLDVDLGGCRFPEVKMRLHYSMVHGARPEQVEPPKLNYVSEERQHDD